MLAVSACHDATGVIRVYDTERGSLIHEFTGHIGLVYDMTWTSGETILTASANGNVATWDIGTRTMRSCLPHASFIYAARQHPVLSDIVVIGGYDGNMFVWSQKKER